MATDGKKNKLEEMQRLLVVAFCAFCGIALLRLPLVLEFLDLFALSLLFHFCSVAILAQAISD